MRFLIDAQLPPALVRWLVDAGHDAKHVFDLDLASASDEEIVQAALVMDAVLITKDEDFHQLHARGAACPRVIWLRLGNTRTKTLVEVLSPQLDRILDALDEGEVFIEIA